MDEKKAAEIFGQNLRRFLDERGWSQNELARKMGVTSATVSDWCRGAKYPRAAKQDILCQLFGCERTDLFDEPEIAAYYHIRREALGLAKRMEEMPNRIILVKLIFQIPEDDLQKVAAMLAIFAKEDTDEKES